MTNHEFYAIIAEYAAINAVLIAAIIIYVRHLGDNHNED